MELDHLAKPVDLLYEAHILVSEGRDLNQKVFASAIVKRERWSGKGRRGGRIRSPRRRRRWRAPAARRIYNGKMHSIKRIWAVVASFGHSTTATAVASSLAFLRVASSLVAVYLCADAIQLVKKGVVSMF